VDEIDHSFRFRMEITARVPFHPAGRFNFGVRVNLGVGINSGFDNLRLADAQDRVAAHKRRK